MVPKGTIPWRAAANCRSTRPISSMTDAMPSPGSAAACSGVISVRLKPLVAAAQSKDWHKCRVPQPPPWLSCAPVLSTTRELDAASTHEAI